MKIPFALKGREAPIEQILLATDLSDNMVGAEMYALGFARELGTHVEIFHAIDAPPRDPSDHTLDEHYEELRREAQAQLDAHGAFFREMGVSCTARVVVGPRWTAIEDRAEAIDADVIVMGVEAETPADWSRCLVAPRNPILYEMN